MALRPVIEDERVSPGGPAARARACGRVLTRGPAPWLIAIPLAAVAALWWALPPGAGIDSAAHAYKVALMRDGAGSVWDGLWYGGSYGAAVYGYLYYAVAARVGEGVLVIAAAGLLPVLFWQYLRGVWGTRGAAAAAAAAGLAVTTLMLLPFGEHPFFVALALGMAGAAALGGQRRSAWALGGALAGLALFVNPLGALCVAVFLAADLLGRPGVRRPLRTFAIAFAPFLALRLAMLVVFAQPSVEIDLLGSQAKYVAMGLVGALLVRLSGDPDRRAKALVFAVAAAACGLAWLVPRNPVGDDMGRFFMLFAVPVLLSVRRLFVPLRVAALAGVALLVLPLTMASAVATRPLPPLAAWQAFFAPGLRLAGRLYEPDYRFEVVPLARHWDAYFFPLAGYPLAQGWYRQSDAIHDLALRAGADDSAARYAAWLRGVGVKYVFVGHAALAPDAAALPGLIARSSQFQKVASAGRWTVYRVRHAGPIVTGSSRATARAAGVTDYDRTIVTIAVRRPGRYLVRVTWSPYWRLALGRGSLSRAPGDWIDLRADGTGVYELSFTITAERLFDQLLGPLTGAAAGGPW